MVTLRHNENRSNRDGLWRQWMSYLHRIYIYTPFEMLTYMLVEETKIRSILAVSTSLKPGHLKIRKHRSKFFSVTPKTISRDNWGKLASIFFNLYYDKKLVSYCVFHKTVHGLFVSLVVHKLIVLSCLFIRH